MNFKTLSIATLLVNSFCLSAASSAEVMPESPKHKEIRIENTLNELFTRAMNTAAVKLDQTKVIEPFAIIKRIDGSLGVFELDQSADKKQLTVNNQHLSIRRLLRELAFEKQITASIQVMYALVQEEGKEQRQGLTFELEHQSGVSLIRFLPVSEQIDKEDEANNKWVFEIELLSTSIKPRTVFSIL